MLNSIGETIKIIYVKLPPNKKGAFGYGRYRTTNE